MSIQFSDESASNESLQMRIALYLESKNLVPTTYSLDTGSGFDFLSPDRTFTGNQQDKSLSVRLSHAIKHPNSFLNFLSRIGIIEKLYECIGNIHFHDDDTWTFELYGRKHKDMITKLCKEMSDHFNIGTITITLTEETVRKQKKQNRFGSS